MDMKTPSKMFAVAVALAIVLKASGDTYTAEQILHVLKSADAANRPDRAAELVSRADLKSLRQTTVMVVAAAVSLESAAAPNIVGCVALAKPDMAATAAATAAVLAPDQADVIAGSAALATPSKADAIVEAMCRAVPQEYEPIADAVATYAPNADRKILDAVVRALPELRIPINEVLSTHRNGFVTVSEVLADVPLAQPAPAIGTSGNPGILFFSQDPRGPSVQPPIVTPSGTPIIILPSAGQVVIAWGCLICPP